MQLFHQERVGDDVDTTGLGGVIGLGFHEAEPPVVMLKLRARSHGPWIFSFFVGCMTPTETSAFSGTVRDGSSIAESNPDWGAGGASARVVKRTGARLGTGGRGKRCLGFSREGIGPWCKRSAVGACRRGMLRDERLIEERRCWR